MFRKLTVCAAAAGLTVLVCGAAANPTARRTLFSLQQRWKIGGEGGWHGLALDTVRHTLYIARDDGITAVNTQTGKTAGQILGSVSAQAVCLDPAGKYGYFSDLGAGVVRVFDRSSLQIVSVIPVGSGPQAIVFEPITKSIVVFNGGSKSATIIDASTQRVIATTPLAGTPSSAVTDGKGNIYVAIEDAGRIQRMDARTREVTASWPAPSCIGPKALAMDAKNERVFCACENNKLLMMNTAGGSVLSTADTGEGPGDIAFEPQRGLVFTANSEGSITVIRSNGERLIQMQQLKTKPGARDLALDPATGRMYVATSAFGLRTGEISEELRFRPTPVPGSFSVLVIGKQSGSDR
jgi:DNA-binding beta-propeller fold protein YncE